MSQLSPFVRAFRALAGALSQESERVANESVRDASFDRAYLLQNVSNALTSAAIDLEQQIAADAARLNRQPDQVLVETTHCSTSEISDKHTR